MESNVLYDKLMWLQLQGVQEGGVLPLALRMRFNFFF